MNLHWGRNKFSCVDPGTFRDVANLTRCPIDRGEPLCSVGRSVANRSDSIAHERNPQVFCCTMKIYLGFTVAGSRSSVEAAKKILNVLQYLGHEVLIIHLVRDDAWGAHRTVAPRNMLIRV